MTYETIADIYLANEKIRRELMATLAEITHDEATTLPEDEKWTIQNIVEHLALVESGVAMICSRLITAAKADGRPSDGSFSISDKFRESLSKLVSGNIKVEAPERVQPTGELTIVDSLTKLNAATATIQTMRNDLESTDVTGQLFPHPFFGTLNAAEWLVIAGLHEGRHISQISALLTKIRQRKEAV